jgi:hypothetical protein
VNRLATATSPYLRQHADNPVDWYPWGEEAFAEARRRDVPILLSVGYAACHWCHVMARESFSDPRIAAWINEHFVPVKVDREERPDVDAIYMQATQAMTGQGGWPMTCFLTPSGEAFYCGTYYPPTPRHGLPSFTQVLEAVARAWRERRDEVVRAAEQINLQLAAPRIRTGEPPTLDQLDTAVEVLARDVDPVHGGLGRAPKFPPSVVLEFLLRHAARTGSQQALDIVASTCEHMARGGIYDQLGGGFARYSVDEAWVVPHFEKMLEDNALLLRVYLHWWRLTGVPLAERVARETADFLLRDMRTPQGGFASALDADSEGVEGKFYVWTPQELREVLGEVDGRYAAELFGVTEEGTFERGTSTLRLPKDPPDPERFAQLRARLREARAQRVPPDRDEKVVASWNGLAITALAEAGALLGEPSYVDAAVRAAELLAAVHTVDGARLIRTSRDGLPGPSQGVLEDYGNVAEAYLTLTSVTGDPRWLERAGALLDRVLSHFGDGRGGFFDTADDAEQLVRRPQDPTDGVAPSGQSAVAGALLTYAALTGSALHREAAEHALGVAGRLAEQAPRAAGWGLAVAEALAAGPLEVAVVGTPGDPAFEALCSVARRTPSPGAVVVAGPPDDTSAAGAPADDGSDGFDRKVSDQSERGTTTPEAGSIPLLAGRTLVRGHAAAYVCRDFVCERPVTDPAELAAMVGVADV